jgi:hypothetical protein
MESCRAGGAGEGFGFVLIQFAAEGKKERGGRGH